MSRVRAPELPQDYPWLNCDRALSLESLKGRIVLLDFWTFGCINCLHILPDLKYLEQKYQDILMVIGIHSAKFDHEKGIETIRQAILKYDIQHPVLVDQNFYVWDQYAVRAWPTLMVIDPAGYVIGYVSGEGNRDVLDELISKIVPDQTATSKLNYQKVGLSLAPSSVITPLAFPGKVLADELSDALFIADSGHHRIVISNLNGLVIQIIGDGQPGFRDGTFEHAQFNLPQGLAFDDFHQCLYVADTANHAIRKIDLKRQIVETLAGTGIQSMITSPHSGIALETALNSPWDLQLLGSTLFIAMAGAHQVWQMQVESAIIMTYAGTGAEGCFDGLTTEAAFAQPSGITTNGSELLIADSETSSIRAIALDNRYRVSTGGLVSLISSSSAPVPTVRTICGSGDLFGFGDVDGSGETVRLQHCLGVEYTQDMLWVADTYNHKIKRVNLQTGQCQTVLGTGKMGYQDGSGQDAWFAEPAGLSATSNHLYVADTNNHAIRQINLRTWAVSTIAFPNLCAPHLCVPTEANS